MNDQFDNYNIMNNIRNDERFFIQEGPNKSFSKKLTEEEYNKEMDGSFNRFEIEPVMEAESIETYLKELLKVKDALEIHIKNYLRECVRTLEKPYNFKEIKKDLDSYEEQLRILDIEIEKRKAMILLQEDFDIKKKIKPMT